MKQILEPLKQRRSFRGFSQEALNRETVDRILEAAVLAPSYSNNQPWRFLVLDRDPHLSALREALTPGNYWAYFAPVLVAAVTSLDWDGRGDQGRDYALFDTGQAVMALQIQATFMGVRSHVMAGFDHDRVKKLLDIPGEAQVPCLVALGWPGPDTHLNPGHQEKERMPRTRRALDQTRSFGPWHPGLFGEG